LRILYIVLYYPVTMYIRLSTKRSEGATYQYLQLCESFRNDKGEPRTRVVANFGRVDKLDAKKIDQTISALLKYASKPALIRPPAETEYGRVRDFGNILALEHLWNHLLLGQTITANLQGNKVAFSVAEMVKVMVLNRACDPHSKLGVMRWLSTVHIPGLKSEEVDYQHLLRAMDYLVEAKKPIEKELFNQLLTLFSPKVDLVFYDLTSSYFEGEGPELASFGYSRDQRPDRKQIVLALVVTREGLPITHEVLAGNTPDVTTLKATVEKLAKRFNIGKTIFVCDRGLISEDNLAALDEFHFPYIIALKPRGNNEAKGLYQKNLSGFQEDKTLGGLRIKEKRQNGFRYILCHNSEVAGKKKMKREHYYAKIRAEAQKLEKQFQRGRLKDVDLHHRVRETIEKYHMSRYLDPKIDDGKLILYIHPEVWEQETFLDGKFFLKTNIDQEELPTPEVVRSYKQLQQVERAFRELKDFLKIRPIFHYTDSRVKAHVFVCVLAYLLEQLIELELKKASKTHSARRALFLLSQLKSIECTANGRSLIVTNQIDPEIEGLLEALGVRKPDKILNN
jgi:transposase